jgi:hypothetical protein
MRPEVEPGLGVHKGHRQVTSCRKQGQVDVRGRIHRVADCQSTLLDTMGEELAVFPVDLCRGDTKEGRKETHSNFPLQGLKEGASVSDHTLDVLPFILKAERKSSIGGLGMALRDDTECLHGAYPFAD